MYDGVHKTAFRKVKGSTCVFWEYFKLGEQGSGFKYIKHDNNDLKIYNNDGCTGPVIYTFDPSWLGALQCPPNKCVQDGGVYKKVSGTGFDPDTDVSPTCTTTATTTTVTTTTTMTYTVMGTVREKGASTVAGVQVTIKYGDSAGNTAAAVTTGANGVWTAVLPSGQFMVEARAAGFYLASRTIQVTGNTNAGPGTDIEIESVATAAAQQVTARTMQLGFFQMKTSYSTTSENAHHFNRPFDSPPVVFILATTQGSHPAAVRTYDATVDTFKAWTVEPPGMDGPHAAMATSYLAAQPGVHRLTDGRYLEVGTISTKEWISRDKTDPKWQTVTFQHDFGATPPALVTGVTSFNNERNQLPSQVSDPFLTVAVQGLTGQGVELILDVGETNTGPHVTNEETIGYIAFQQGFGDLVDNEGNTATIASLLSQKIVRGWGDSGTSVPYGGTVGGSNFVAGSVVTRTDPDGGWLRVGTRADTYAKIYVDEDTTRDSERSHSAEQVALIVASGEFSI